MIMKKMTAIAFFTVLFAGTLLLTSCRTPELEKEDLAAPAPKVTILYPQWKYKAVTFSYDDGTIEDRRLVALFNKYDLKATFNISSGRVGEIRPRFVKLSEMKKLYEGHEIASHGKTHLPMAKQKVEKIHSEIREDKEVLGKVAGYPIRGFAYPYGQTSPLVREILAKEGMEYARTVGATRRFFLPKNFLLWHSTAHHNHNIAALADKYLALPEKEMTLFYIWGHSYEFERQKNWKMMEDFCKKISGKKNIWYATNIEICDYVKASRKLTFTHGKRAGKNNSSHALYLLVNGKKELLPPGRSYLFKSGKIVTFLEK